jgi:ABC-type uncharacterized transport system permease subunit
MSPRLLDLPICSPYLLGHVAILFAKAMGYRVNACKALTAPLSPFL